MTLTELWNEVRYRVRAVLRREAVDRELDDEIRFHVEREADKYTALGVPRREAQRRARLAFGGVSRIKEDTRDARGVTMLEHVVQDVRYALRGLRSRPVFTGVVIATLALGVGVNAAMFGIIDRLLFRAPGYLFDPGSVSRVYVQWTGTDGQRPFQRSLAYATYADLARWNRSLSELAAFAYRTMAVGDGDETRDRQVGLVSASFFDFFSARPVIGRFFGAQEDTSTARDAVVVLSYGYWQSRYAGRADVIGTSIRAGKGTYRVIGVAPPGFDGVSDQRAPVAFIPIAVHAATDDPAFDKNYGWTWLEVLVRAKPGMSARAVAADLTNAFRQSWNAERAIEPGLASADVARPTVVAGPPQFARGPMAGPETKVVVWIGGVAVTVLLIACANIANLLLARALRRRREMALRQAIGGSRARLVQQLFTETMVLATVATVVGLVGAQIAASGLRKLLIATDDSWPVVTDSRTVLFAAVLTVVIALLAGLLPALHAGSGDLAGSLKSGMREGVYRQSRARAVLLVFQTALSVVLLVGAGLFVRSLQQVRALRLGYDVDHLAYVQTAMRGVRLSDAEARALAERLRAEARAIPGVATATLTVSVPFWYDEGRSLWVTGIDSVRRLGRFQLQAGSPEYFATVGTQILRGRWVSPSDRAGSPRVAVVSQAMAKVLWNGHDPIGKCFRIGSDTMPCTTVVGVAENIRARKLTGAPEFEYYLPIDQYIAAFGQPPMLALFVRTAGRSDDYVEPLRARLQRLMPGPSYLTVMPFHEIVEPTMQSWISGARMFLMFGVLALVLAAVGLYAVIAFAVAQRTQELGVRIALGARAADVLGLVVGEGLRVTLEGLAIGIAIALIGSAGIRSLLYGVSPYDPVVYGFVGLTLLVVGALASAIPASRAARLDPNRALRAE